MGVTYEILLGNDFASLEQIGSEYEEGRVDIITLSDSSYHVMQLQFKDNFYIEYVNEDWVTVEKNDNTLTFYLQENIVDSSKYENVEGRFFSAVIVNNSSAERIKLVIYQPYPKYDIVLIGNSPIELRGNGECKDYNINNLNDVKDNILSSEEFKCQVYGGVKDFDCFIQRIEKIDEDKEYFLENDNAFFIENILPIDNSNEEYTEYTLRLNYISGLINNKENSCYYKLIFKHKNIANPLETKSLDVKFIYDERNEELLDTLYNETCKSYNYNDIIKVNNENKEKVIEKTKVFNVRRMNSAVSLLNNEIENETLYEPIKLLTIVDNIIVVETNNDKGEKNSALVIKSNAVWCHYDSYYNKEKKYHFIIIRCDKRYMDKERIATLFISNVENKEKTLSFDIKQNKDDVKISFID